ncbi:hypothetical protein R3I93_014324 [Phoxinus phoxinus]|uniref:UPAR/Ly6 domain-containing protein n=1 Tax=Phoxinus phoxinus TaxID=58324 RepID=A0AAN9CSV4_9TELE
MDLQLSVFLLFILFTAGTKTNSVCDVTGYKYRSLMSLSLCFIPKGHSLSCYECMSETGSCAGQKVKTCPSGYSQCMSSTVVAQVGDITFKVKIKDCAVACQSGSINFGIVKMTSSCCNTNKCNAQDAPEPVSNGKKCYFCDEQQSCSNTVKCSGTEDRCIKATATATGQSLVVKGCVSKSIFDATSVSVQSCSGNLCNGAQSVTQSVLFLCCSLLSYFLMH